MTSRKTTAPKNKSPTNAAADERQRLRLLKRRLLFKSVSTVTKAAATSAAAAAAAATVALNPSAASATASTPTPQPLKRHRTFGLSLHTGPKHRRNGVRRQQQEKRPKTSSPPPSKRKSQRSAVLDNSLNSNDHRQPDAKRTRLNGGTQAIHMTHAHQYDDTTTTTSSTQHVHTKQQQRPPLYAHHQQQPSQQHHSMDDATQGLDTRLNGIHMSHSGVGGGGMPPPSSLLNNNNGNKSHHHQQYNNHHHQQSAIHSAAAPPLPPGKQIAAATMATLGNIGNTCYLNSVIYTLRFAPHFLHNLHHLVEDLAQVTQRLNGAAAKAKSSSLGRNVGGLAGTNSRSWSTKDLASMSSSSAATVTSSLGGAGSAAGGLLPLLSAADMPRTQRQIATEKLHDLFAALRRNEVSDSQDAFHAGNFLGAVQDVSAIFEGNQQQDAHEFLMCVLDAIRETCQALTRVIGECPDIIMNGYVNVPEKVEPAPTIQHTPSVRLPFFRKNKSKPNRLESPSKESAATATATTASTDAYVASAASVATSNNDAGSSADAIDGSATSSSAAGVGAKKDEAKAKALSDRIRELGLDFFTEDFEGVTVSSTKCLSCETVTEQKETMIDLSVPITGYESQDKLADQFIQDLCITREYFNSENKYRCEVCTGLTEAIRTVSYPVLPRLLIIQLKRFSGGMEKINSFIPTPFTMQCFCSRCCALPDGEKLHVYRLYSVITHVGATLSVGHYIAYTSALDGYGDHYSCPKVKRKTAQQLQQQLQLQQQQQLLANGTAAAKSSAATTAALGMPPVPQPAAAPSEKNPGLLKKIMFGRSKASSSGDVTKQMKSALNGITGGGGGSLKHHNSMTNGSSSSSSHGLGSSTAATSGDSAAKNAAAAAANAPCTSLTCCGIMTKPIGVAINGHSNGGGGGTLDTLSSALSSKSGSLYSASSATSDYYSASTTTTNASTTGAVTPTTTTTNGGGGAAGLLDTMTDSPMSSTTPNGSIGNGQAKAATLPPPPPPAADTTWYMCDDDKIKALSQREFEELLSPNSKKIMITPYLLFYARSTLQP